MNFDNYKSYLKEDKDVFETKIDELKKKIPGKDLDKFEKKVRLFRKESDKVKAFKDLFGIEIEVPKEDDITKELEELKTNLDTISFSQLKAKFNRYSASGDSKEEALKKAKEEILPKREKEKKTEENKSANIDIHTPSSVTKLNTFTVKFVPSAKTIMWTKGNVKDRGVDISVASSFSLEPKKGNTILTMPSLYSKNENVLKEELESLNIEIKKIVDKEIKVLNKELKKMGYEVKDTKFNWEDEEVESKDGE